VSDQADDGKVIDQRPAAGTEVQEGRPVVIIIGAFVEADVIRPDEQPPATP
jgi:beta-lactam-binding protein with PASTA domain